MERPSPSCMPTVLCARHLDRVRDRPLLAELRLRLLSTGQTIEATRSLTLVEVEFEQRRVCLVVDRRWLALAAEARRLDADLVEGIGVPTTALVALLDGTAAQWSNIDPSIVHSCFRPDGTLVLLLGDRTSCPRRS